MGSKKLSNIAIIKAVMSIGVHQEEVLEKMKKMAKTNKANADLFTATTQGLNKAAEKSVKVSRSQTVTDLLAVRRPLTSEQQYKMMQAEFKAIQSKLDVLAVKCNNLRNQNAAPSEEKPHRLKKT